MANRRVWANRLACSLVTVGLLLGSAQRKLVAQPSAKSKSTAVFTPADFKVPAGMTVELAAGPPLVSHPIMACFDDRGRLFVAESAGLNLSAGDLEKELPNSIRMLEDTDGDGRFDRSTVFADRMTFPMGGTWHDGALYVASPPSIWRLEDTDGDGVADRRETLVNHFGYTGNAASIHGCFTGPDGRLYWCDGYHGHEFRDAQGRVTSKRKGSYIFSCRPDGSDVRIHCGGGMDNPVEVDFTDEGEMLGTVNIFYTRPRVDCLVHWLYGGAYPHREQVLDELQTTGELLGPAHRFGHVAVSGMMRYRSGALNSQWRNNVFVTFFNSGKVVRLELERKGSTFQATQREFLSSTSQGVHPTDVLEDADGSLLVVDTGGWFYRGCPTSQIAKPDVLGAIYRVRRQGALAVDDPWGRRIRFEKLSHDQLVSLLDDGRFQVRQRAIQHCAQRAGAIVPSLERALQRGNTKTRLNAVWALVRIVSNAISNKTTAVAPGAQDQERAAHARSVIRQALVDSEVSVRQAACHSLAVNPDRRAVAQLLNILQTDQPAVRLAAARALGRCGDPQAVPGLLQTLRLKLDRSLEHSVVW
ncbi:MAG: PVC-type heme-binding CxxCH protein, partial [Planctomycetaceae bacterium]